MYNQLLTVLLKKGFTENRAQLCAKLFTETSCDGVYSHGLNRFPRFIEYIDNNIVNIHARPELCEKLGSIERYDGQSGPGNLNAHFAMSRAIQLAQENGMGCVTLKNTNHWMRAGSYGLMAAEAGCIGICWTNTTPNLPPWGGFECKLGNNPLVLAVPRETGHILLDIATSQFSYGKLENLSLQNKELPIEGGYDENGNLTKNPQAILKSRRPLPIGYWKGSGLSLLLDLIGMMLSGGKTTFEIGKFDVEQNLSQVFLVIDSTQFKDNHLLMQSVEETINDLHNTLPIDEDNQVRYPGEQTLKTRIENLEKGIPVDKSVWDAILKM